MSVQRILSKLCAKSLSEGLCFVFALVAQGSELFKTSNLVKFARSKSLVTQPDKFGDALIDGPLFYTKSKGYNTTSTDRGSQQSLRLLKELPYLVPTIRSKNAWIGILPPRASSIALRVSSSRIPRIPPLYPISHGYRPIVCHYRPVKRENSHTSVVWFEMDNPRSLEFLSPMKWAIIHKH